MICPIFKKFKNFFENVQFWKTSEYWRISAVMTHKNIFLRFWTEIPGQQRFVDLSVFTSKITTEVSERNCFFLGIVKFFFIICICSWFNTCDVCPETLFRIALFLFWIVIRIFVWLLSKCGSCQPQIVRMFAWIYRTYFSRILYFWSFWKLNTHVNRTFSLMKCATISWNFHTWIENKMNCKKWILLSHIIVGVHEVAFYSVFHRHDCVFLLVIMYT